MVVAPKVAESTVEEATLAWLTEIGWQLAYGPDVEPEKLGAERDDFSEVVLTRRLTAALERINPELPSSSLDQVVRTVLRVEHPSLVENNRRFHRLLVNGVDVEVKQPDGSTRTDKVWLADFAHPSLNDFLAVNQFTVVEAGHKRRPDVVLFVNGLPLGVVELKNPSEENATAETAFHQLQTYKQDIPSLFHTNELLVVSDGLETRAGTLTAAWERFAPWRTIDGVGVEPPTTPGLETLVRGMLEPSRLLDLIRHFVVFEDDGATVSKKMAAYHQYWAVNKAVAETLRAVDQAGDRRIGVVWHTQGSGKSLSMAFYAGKIILQPSCATQRSSLSPIATTWTSSSTAPFAAVQELLRQTPVQAASREDLRDMLRVAAGGVVFTTIQKFLPDEGERQSPLCRDRRNIVVIADEAHRSQYDFIETASPVKHCATPCPTPPSSASRARPSSLPTEHARRLRRLHRHLRHPAGRRGRRHRADLLRGRLAKIELDEAERPNIDPDFEEVTEAEEVERQGEAEEQVGPSRGPGRRREARQADRRRSGRALRGTPRGDGGQGDGGLHEPAHLRRAVRRNRRAPSRVARDDDDSGVIKVVMTGSAPDPLDWQRHIRNKARREALAQRFKDPADPFKVVIVRDMWLTGFDAPCLHTMYVDKPMRGHGLMQAIARVNRVFRDKPGGLVVDYIGLADQLKRAVATYTESGGAGDVAVDQAAAVAVMQEKYEIVCDLLFGLDFSAVHQPLDAQAKMSLTAELTADAMELVLGQENGKRRFMDAVSQLSKAFALAVPADEASAIRDEVGFFQTVRAQFAKSTARDGRSDEELDSAVRQIVSRAVVPEGWAAILDLKGQRKDISILDDGFLAEIRGMARRNLAVELLEKLTSDEIKTRLRHNLVESRSFSEMLARTVDEYNNRTITAEEALERLIALAGQIKAARERGQELGLNDEELAFYDALETNDAAVALMGDELLRKIAQELAVQVRRNATVDWSLFASSRARMRLAVKKLLRRYHYPPDKQEKATQTVLEQAELFGEEWAS